MDNFINFSKQQVVLATNTSSIDNVFVVWSCKTLQNKKALLSTTDKGANYFEVTYNGDKGEYYIDEYKKVSNKVMVVSK